MLHSNTKKACILLVILATYSLLQTRVRPTPSTRPWSREGKGRKWNETKRISTYLWFRQRKQASNKKCLIKHQNLKIVLYKITHLFNQFAIIKILVTSTWANKTTPNKRTNKKKKTRNFTTKNNSLRTKTTGSTLSSLYNVNHTHAHTSYSTK